MTTNLTEVQSGLQAALRRVLLGVLVLSTIAWCALQSWELLTINGFAPLEGVLFGLSLILFVPLSVQFWIAVLGFLVDMLRGHKPSPPELEPLGAVRVAVVMPVYNEDPLRFMAGLRATFESLAETRFAGNFDFWVLSDTNDPDMWLEEELAFAELRDSVAEPARLRYRNRPQNRERKAGNILDFCQASGAAYRYMIVLDADSVLSGDCIVELVRAMEADPRAGIIQAPPVPVNRRTLFGRAQQFATGAYGRNAIWGLDYWQGGQGNYWGHNAIVRIAPFLEHCRLPVLSGAEPLGGPILSHDFVEAALMIGGGWKVYLLPEIEGSYEETPPSLVEYAARDRRWCQGNLQHLRLLGHPGLSAISRIHLALGALSYLASPIWLAFLALGTAEALRQSLVPHEYFPQGPSLSPVWRIDIFPRSVLLLLSVGTLLFLPKLLGLVSCLRDRERTRAFGGAARLLASAFVEGLFSILMAPVLAVLQARFVGVILLGRKVEWNGQERGERGTTWGEAVRRHGGTTLLGALALLAVARVLPDFLPWLAPVLAGFLLAIPLSVISSRVGPGQWMLAKGLLATPEELDPPRVLERFRTLHVEPVVPPEHGDALERVIHDARAREVHLALGATSSAADPLEAHHLAGLCLKRELCGPGALDDRERRLLLLDGDSVRRLARGRAPREALHAL